MGFVLNLVSLVISVFYYAIIASVIISLLRSLGGVRINPYNPIVRIIDDIAELVLRPIRRTFPVTGGGIDFSPMVAIIILILIRQLIFRAF